MNDVITTLKTVFATPRATAFEGTVAEVRKAVKSVTNVKFKTKKTGDIVEVFFEYQPARQVNGEFIVPANPSDEIFAKYHWSVAH